MLSDSYWVLDVLGRMRPGNHPVVELLQRDVLGVLAEARSTARIAKAQLRRVGRRVETARNGGLLVQAGACVCH